MYFKKLELIGFKSFLEKTTLHFEPGITAVVGPNGCGKSNIFDAIRWVLGEQSAKSLRGSEMQDVIFNGTDKKDPLGMAEVSLSFDNTMRFFSLEAPEVTVTRRLFRSGESEYLLNKTPVRLKDITELLLGTGIGAESYSIVAQGKIDLVLSSKPDERRLVFDEASGITKFKADKRETMRKLQDTESNLARVNDIITEVKRQISSLERQATKARKYKEAFEELKTKETYSALLHLKELGARKEQLDLQIEKLTQESLSCESRVKEQESRISNRQSELAAAENRLMAVKETLMSLDTAILRNHEKIQFSRERIGELRKEEEELLLQTERLQLKLKSDEEKLAVSRREYQELSTLRQEKERLLTEQGAAIEAHTRTIKQSQMKVQQAKQRIVDLAARIASGRNEINDCNSQQQIYQARKKRLEVEKAKIHEEEAITFDSLKTITREVETLRARLEELNGSLAQVGSELTSEQLAADTMREQIERCKNSLLTLDSHKEFLQKLRTKYDDIGESMDAAVYLNRIPAGPLSGLVVKIDETQVPASSAEGYRYAGEAKPIELDTRMIDEKIGQLSAELEGVTVTLQAKELRISELKAQRASLQKEAHQQEIACTNKETSRKTIEDHYTKIKQEADVIVIELADVERELAVLSQNLSNRTEYVAGLQREQREAESAIAQEEEAGVLNTAARETALVALTQTRTELEGLTQRILSDEGTLKIIEDAFAQDRAGLEASTRQIESLRRKAGELADQIAGCEGDIEKAAAEREARQELLKEQEAAYKTIAGGAQDAASQIDGDRQELERLKSQLYDLQMEAKDIDYRSLSITDRMNDAYKVVIDPSGDIPAGLDRGSLDPEIQVLKRRVDSYGAVNLVAIEEYDELKQRYDFLVQQQNDLLTAKETLHQAILKINRTTRQLFLETFEKVKEEFRNYFRILFNGGDAQIFLTDESDPLESGIEIICRPPGKKLQNVLLLSGGEKSLSAIALIFAIFKIKPSPFCVLDEIDAALDEANVDRLGRILQEFSQTSQFIVITHNKRTIASANVMYGITMQESGVSKIVSVKFNQDAPAAETDTVSQAA